MYKAKFSSQQRAYMNIQKNLVILPKKVDPKKSNGILKWHTIFMRIMTKSVSVALTTSLNWSYRVENCVCFTACKIAFN